MPGPLSLTGGTRYYLSIYNDVGAWAWLAGSGPNDLIYYRLGLVGVWDTGGNSHDQAFQLTDTIIPEPLTALLFGGSVLFGLARFRRQLH